MTAKAMWFKKKKEEQVKYNINIQVNAEVKPKGSKPTHKVPPETVLFAPHTPGGELKKILQDIDDQVMGSQRYGRVRVVEKLGSSLIEALGNQAPWRSGQCGRSQCWPCKSKEGSCRKHNVLYRIACLTCKG